MRPEVEQCFLIRIEDDRSQRRGAVESRRSMRVDGLAHEVGAICHRGDVDGRPRKVDASANALKIDRWKTAAAAASESAPDRCVPQTWHCDLVGVFGSRC